MSSVQDCAPSRSRAGQHKRKRLRHAIRRLRGELAALLQRADGVELLGSDPLIGYYAQRHGVPSHELAACQIVLDEEPMTIIGVTNRIWYSSDGMRRLQEVTSSMAAAGRSCMLLPQYEIMTSPAEDLCWSDTFRSWLRPGELSQADFSPGDDIRA